MGGQLANRADTTRRRAGDRSCPTLLALLAVLAALAAPDPAGAQQGTAADTARAGTLSADTVPADTTLTLRERALRRLRALPRTPIQPDSATVDSLRADSLAADSLRADSLRADSPSADSLGADSLTPDRLRADTLRAESPGGEPVQRAPPSDTAAPAAEAPDSLAGVGGVVPPGRLRPELPDTTRWPLERPLRLGRRDTAAARADPGPVREEAVREQLQALEGYVTTEYSGQTAVFWADSNQLRLSGESRISRERSALATDSLLVYDGESGVVCGYGAPVLSGETEPVESRRVCFDIERDVGMAEGARTKFTQQGTWYVRGADNRVFVLAGEESNTLYGRRAEFTSCDLDHPHYAFQARSLKMVEGEMLVARDVTLQFEDVPVFWLPWMVQSMKRGRRSGLLVPQFGVNDIVRNNTGYSRRISNVGFYWAINDYASARGTFEWWAGNWTAVEGALSYYWRRQFLQGSLTAKHYWRQQEGVPAGREFTLNTSNSWQPDERTRLRLDARYASSTDFVRRNSFDPRELNQTIRSSASANRTFDWGSVTLGADRQQQLSTEQVDWTLPSLQLSLSPVTIYSSEDGMDITWRGSGNATRRSRDVSEALQPNLRDSETLNSSINQSLSVGKFSFGQNVDYRREELGARRDASGTDPSLTSAESLLGVDLFSPPGVPDPASTSETVGWSTSVGFQQALWIGTTLNPSVSVNGTYIRDDSTRHWLDELNAGSPSGFVAQPVRLSAGASLTTAIYGFWPGFARYSRIRHKIAPTLRWSYSPKPTTTALQDSVFGTLNLRQRNELTLSFNQTFEAKVESDDTVAADSVVGQPGEPRRLPQAEKITLLAINTGTPLRYDFVAAEEDGRGFQTTRITNSIRSDLVQGLQLSMTHDLFEVGETPEDGGPAPRTFSPFLTNLSTSFSIDSDFWLFRFLGLSAGEAEPAEEPQDTVQPEPEVMDVGAEASADRRGGGFGGVVPGNEDRGGIGMESGGTGRWRAALSYSLQRSRAQAGTGLADSGSQLVRANVSFDPTEHWSVRWSTSYSFTESRFADHILTLTRDLHRWQANFDFLKARNGNFAFQFRVELRDNRDLKLDYDQRTRGGAVPAPGRPGGVVPR
ncbi:MAG: putative LPS assembly protein LptD [Longimicrobiales bacterium]|nr:putative LPS assembly protein LptD [Longimicrobiales bacterium]